MAHKYKQNEYKNNTRQLVHVTAIKIGWLAPWLSKDKGISLPEAIGRIYRSKLYKKLATASTLYWQLSPVDLYKELVNEF